MVNDLVSFLLLVHPVDDLPVVLRDDGAAQLQRIGQLAAMLKGWGRRVKRFTCS